MLTGGTPFFVLSVRHWCKTLVVCRCG